jgi:ubiquitin-protein ligase
MGFLKSLFVDSVDDELLCAICCDVQEAPTSCRCGHTFCNVCLDQWTTDHPTCPTCRLELERVIVNNDDDDDDDSNDMEETELDTYYNKALERMIHKLKVKCQNKKEHGNNNNNNTSTNEGEEPASQRRKLNENNNTNTTCTEESGSSSDCTRTSCCTWTGTLGDWKDKHKDECPHEKVKCVIPGCEFECLRRDMDTHLADGGGRLAHMRLMVQEETEKAKVSIQKELEVVFQAERLTLIQTYESKIASLQQNMEGPSINLYLLQFCRQWLQQKPDALYDFVVYREPRGHRTTGYMSRLLVGIPGPLNTPWEGGLFPMLMEWKSLSCPPTCRFPKGFLHVNVYPSGTISSHILNPNHCEHVDSNYSAPELSIPEILFSIQHFLAHPNPSSPAQSPAYNMHLYDPEGYKEKTKELAQKWAAGGGGGGDDGGTGAGDLISLIDDSTFTDVLSNPISALRHGMRLVDDRARQLSSLEEGQEYKPKRQPRVPKLPPGSKCSCSCCAWGKTFWDPKGEMRYIFSL